MKIINKLLIYSLYILLVISIFSCSTRNSEIKNSEIEKDNKVETTGHYEYKEGLWGVIKYKIEEKTIDECEYIIIFGSEGRNIIHKANCSNSFHNSH